jgi:hypothetical protein
MPDPGSLRRLLIVSPHFPPANAPDLQRVRMSLPYFREFGWEPTVLAVDAAQAGAPLDPLLATTVPGDIAVHRCGAVPARWARCAGFGNIAYRAWFQLRAAGDRLLRDGHFDLVYFSTTQFVTTALGARWQERFNVPFVVDIQDPWRTDYYERPGAPRPPGGWKYRFARWQAARLEESSWRPAAGFVSVSANYLDQLRSRYPWFAARPSAVIPFGASESDFTLVRGRNDLAPAFSREPGTLCLVSVGAIGPIMRRALEHLFDGVKELRRQAPAEAARLRFHFIGTSYAPAGRTAQSVAPLAAARGVGDLVREQPERVGYFTAIKTLLAADAIVIPGSDDPGYNPSKTDLCFLAEKPVLVVTPADSALERMVRELGFATVARCPAPEGDRVLAEFFHALLAGPAAPRPASRNLALFTTTHTARARTGQQCELLARALAFRDD